MKKVKGVRPISYGRSESRILCGCGGKMYDGREGR